MLLAGPPCRDRPSRAPQAGHCCWRPSNLLPHSLGEEGRTLRALCMHDLAQTFNLLVLLLDQLGQLHQTLLHLGHDLHKQLA